MGIFSRVSDIVDANINDLLDRAEDPEKMVKLLIIEMEEHIEKAREGLVKAVAGEKGLSLFGIRRILRIDHKARVSAGTE